MYLFGHLGLVLGTNHLIERKYKIKNSKLYLGLGSMFPDMIDKPIGSLFFNNGRWFGHSMLFLITFSLFLLIITHFTKSPKLDRIQLNINNIFLFFIGNLGHLLGDYGIKKEVVFFPIFGNFPPGSRTGFFNSISDPIVISLDLIGFLVLNIIGWRERWKKTNWIMLYALLVLYLSAIIVGYYVLVIWKLI